MPEHANLRHTSYAPAVSRAADAAAAAFYAARPKALRLLRQLAAASKAAARQLQESGLVRFALDQLLCATVLPAPGSSDSASGGSTGSGAAAGPCRPAQQMGLLTEALRLWRSFAQHGFYLLSLDDAYPSLCIFFSPPAAVAAAACEGQVPPAEALQQWCMAREAYSTAAQLCWHAAR